MNPTIYLFSSYHKMKIQPCTHPVGENKFGIFAMHSFDNQALPPVKLQKFLDGPITLAQSKLNADLDNPKRESIPALEW